MRDEALTAALVGLVVGGVAGYLVSRRVPRLNPPLPADVDPREYDRFSTGLSGAELWKLARARLAEKEGAEAHRGNVLEELRRIKVERYRDVFKGSQMGLL